MSYLVVYHSLSGKYTYMCLVQNHCVKVERSYKDNALKNKYCEHPCRGQFLQLSLNYIRLLWSGLNYVSGYLHYALGLFFVSRELLCTWCTVKHWHTLVWHDGDTKHPAPMSKNRLSPSKMYLSWILWDHFQTRTCWLPHQICHFHRLLVASFGLVPAPPGCFALMTLATGFVSPTPISIRSPFLRPNSWSNARMNRWKVPGEVATLT